ncbi:mitochondrial import receptor subunit TOM7 homolog isoform X2 [Camelus bactrianus]|uniref:Mitochondrial import receptor subunit TOM7 homolog isoform X2 n=2 Tax=Camelus bactrianus TaxID=9837 RepID=A0AC58QMG7_CAMBA
MVKLSKEAKQRLQQLFKGGQFAIRWGFIPLVIYLGFKRGADPGMPEPTILSELRLNISRTSLKEYKEKKSVKNQNASFSIHGQKSTTALHAQQLTEF